MNYVAMDIGASGAKAYLGRFDGERLRVSALHRYAHGSVGLGGGLYWDFIGMYSNLLTGIRLAGQETGGSIDSLGIDSFSNDFGLIDGRGNLMTPVRCYRDERTKRTAESAYRRVSKRRLYQMTGNQIAPFNTLMQLHAMREEGQGPLIDLADKLLLIPDLLGYYLTGEVRSEYSISSVTQMFDLDAGDWHDEILTAFHISRGLLAPIGMPGTALGVLKPGLAGELGVNALRVSTVLHHDTASAFIAADDGDDGAMLSCGTWALLGAHGKAPIIDEYTYRHNIANEGGYPGYHRLSINVMGNWLMQQLRHEYARAGEEYSYGQWMEMAAREAPLRFVIDVDDALFYAPGPMAERIRAHCAAHDEALPETPGQLARALYDSLALKYRLAVERLQRATGRTFDRLTLVGGGAGDALSCQLTADCTQKTVRAGSPDATAVGNILMQMVATGEVSSIEQGMEVARRSFPVRTYEPASREMWDEAYCAFCERYGFDL